MFCEIRGHTFFTPPLNVFSVVLDVGANHGEFTDEMSEQFDCTYYLVEANPILANRLSQNRNDCVIHCALTDSDGQICLNISENDTGSSILNLPDESVYGCVKAASVFVPSKTLDTLLSQISEERIDLVKMDIEGAEVKVLKELSKSVLGKVGQFSVEFHSDPSFGFNLQSEVEECIRNLRKNDFICLDFSNGTRMDVLCINRRIHDIPRLKWMMWQYRLEPPTWLSKIWGCFPPSLKVLVRHQMNRVVNRGQR